MRKKLMVLLILLLTISVNTFAQKIERLTFSEMRADGTIIGTVTVNAIFMTWTQQRITIENGMQVFRESVYINNEWTPFEIAGREPPQLPTIRQVYNLMLQHYSNYPRSSRRVNISGVQAVRIMTIPSNKSSPIWWSDDGKSFNIFYEVWGIVP